MDEYADISGGEMLEDSNLLQDLAGNAFNVQTCVFATVVLCTTLAFLHQEREKARQMQIAAGHAASKSSVGCAIVRGGAASAHRSFSELMSDSDAESTSECNYLG